MGNRIGALPKDIKAMNDREILRTMVDMQTFTVQDIASRTGISRLTISRALERFMVREIIISAGKGRSTNVGGKKPQEYTLNKSRYIISISPTHSVNVCSLMALDGTLIDEIDGPFPMNIPYEAFLEDVARCISHLLDSNHISLSCLKGILICFGGVIDRRDGIVRVPSMPGFPRNLYFVEDLHRYFGPDILIEVENVSKVSSSILRFNDEMRQKRTAFMYADYGVSITLMEDGIIPETAHNVNGELGHMCLEPGDSEQCVCGAHGCFEVLVSARRIWKMVNQLPPKEKEMLLEGYEKSTDIRTHILKKESDGCSATQPICNYLAKYIGLAFRNVSLAVDPDSFLISGVFSHASDRFLESIKNVMRENQYLADAEIVIYTEKQELVEQLRKGSLNLILSSLLEERE